MANGGANIDWDETSPAGSQSVGLGDDRIREFKTSVRSGLDSEHHWPSSSSTAGAHRAGSARAFFGTQSRVSSSDTDGRLMVTSDTSKLFGVGSGGTVQLGAGPLGLSLGSYTPVTFPQRLQVAMEIGEVKGGSGGTFNVTFASAFSAAPMVFLSSSATSSANGVTPLGWHSNLLAVTTSGFSGFTLFTNEAVLSNTTLSWIAIGHRAL